MCLSGACFHFQEWSLRARFCMYRRTHWYIFFANILCKKQRTINCYTTCMLGESPLETPKASMHIHRATARALCLASATPLLWFLYWIGHGIVVKADWLPFMLNCVGLDLSLLFTFAVTRLTTVKNMVNIPKKKENEELANIVDELIELQYQYEELVISLKAPK